jgi:hypothetical protein
MHNRETVKRRKSVGECIMAVNINVGTQRHESNTNENFEEAVDQNTQQEQQEPGAQSQLSHQPGSHADTPSALEPIAAPPEEVPPPPAFARYGFGDTVVMGAPDYVRAYADRAEPSAGKPGSRETAFAPAQRAENTPASAGTATTVKPIPMPKPGGNLSPAPALISSELAPVLEPAPTHNAPQIEGASVIVPPAPATVTATTPPATDLTFEQGMADLTLGDPLNQELIARYDQEHPGANLVEHGNATADHLVATYGEARLNDLAILHQALSLVRDDYVKALSAAEARGPSFDNAAFWKPTAGSSGDGGTDAPVFDNEAFTRWYAAQDGLSNRAFAANYAYGGVGTVTHSQGDNSIPVETTTLSGGTSVIVHQRMETSSEGGTSVNVPRFAAPGLVILGGPTCGIELHDPKAVWFDPTLGFVTSATNVVDNDDFFDKYMMVIIVTAATAGAGAAGILPTAATFGGGTSGAILAGAANSVITSALVTAAQGGDITFKGLFQAALTGGIMGGLSTVSQYQTMQNLGLDTTTNTVTNYALRAVSITGQATLQGALRELVGGRFRDGFTQGLVQGLAGEITRALNSDIAGRVTRGELTAEQGRFLNEMSRATGSAIRAAANPNDPAFAFAQDYLTQLLGTTSVNDNSPIDAETRQQIAWIREAIDSGNNDTAAAFLNDIIDRRIADNQSLYRTDASAQLMESLGIKPEGTGFVLTQEGRVIALDPFKPMGTDSLTYREQLARQLGVNPNDLIDVALRDGVSNTDRRLDVLPAIDTAFDDRAVTACADGNSASCDFARQTYGAAAIEISTYRDELIERLSYTRDLTDRQAISNEIRAMNVGYRGAIGKLITTMELQNQNGQLSSTDQQALVGLRAAERNDSITALTMGSVIARPGGLLRRLVPEIQMPRVEFSKPNENLWELGPTRRGDYIHDAAGGNLPHNFPKIDDFDFATGMATSIKSTDLGLPTYQRASSLERQLNKYVDDVAGFNGGKWNEPEITITAGAVRGRALDVYIPDRPMAPSQMLALNRVIQYGLTQGVTVHFIRTK